MLLQTNTARAVLTSAILGIAAATPIAADAATFVIVNADGAGEGFNDPTAAAPIGGNAGTTVGQQRLIAFQHAADIWGARLQSSVAIRVQGQWNPLSCTASGGVLGSAGAINFFRDFSGAPVAGTWFPIALANALHGSDLDAANDINATFNSSWGTAGCGAASGWYYGLDGLSPGNRIDFVTVLLHELGHGLGFLTIVNLATGQKALGFNDTYMRFLENHGASPSDYPSMTDGQRVAASISTGNLHWTGANLRAASGVLSAGSVGDHVRMFAPNPQQPGSSVSHFDTALTPNQLMEPSYTAPLHNPVLELPLFRDIGWTIPDTDNDLLIDFGSSGLWFRLNNATWAKVHNTSPVLVAAGDLDGSGQDEAIASFAGLGLYARFNNTSTWTPLTSAVPTLLATGDLDGNGRDDIIADFGASGVWVYFNHTSWTKLHNGPAQDLETGDLDGGSQDDVLVDLGASGLWVRFNNSTWTKLHNSSPTQIATGDLDNNGQDEAIVDFGASGIWSRYNNATWTKLHNSTSQGLVTGDLDSDARDDLVIDFGGPGLWGFFNNATFSKLHASSPVAIDTGDLDSSGQDDVLADFGALGFWVRFNNSTWVKLHNGPIQVFTSGSFD